ncbi:endonuclease [Paucihalobacter sp.]|uniref:endonuclease n=1 Tax=Paucihalobacter sp. TaxID=2850405 RepID=UPI002FE29F4E
MKLFYALIASFIGSSMFAQIVVINELDCDTPGVDDKEFVELKSATPNFPLDGFILVFFNGSASGGNRSYLALDLAGYTTDSNGLLLIGSTTVVPFPQYIIPPNVIQNGEDALAIYQACIDDFPGETLATQTNLIDALVYGTNDPIATGLLELLGVNEQINEGPNNNTNSIQRFVDGEGNVFYEATTPTPRQNNDGSGIIFNGITISVPQEMYNEGDVFDITFTADFVVSEDFTFTISLNNDGFNEEDFTGDTTLTIPNGESAVSTTINIIDDDFDEGDEVMKIRILNLEEPYIKNNSVVEVRIVDNDFVMAPWGTPINPTYGIVESTRPDGYYNSLNGLAGDDLKQALQNIIADQNKVRIHSYADVIDILKAADQNPLNSNQVWLVYREEGKPKLDFQTGSSGVGKWNREHTYPRSRGGFNSIDDDDIADGIDFFWITNADSLRHGNSDAHALRAVDASENSSRGNQHYGQYNGPAGTLGGFKGDVARGVLYMDIRFNGLSVVDGFPNVTGQLGDLQTILTWHRNDAPDDFEMNRNNVVYEWQHNRNPFIDLPDLVEYIWGNMVGEVWDQELSITDSALNQLKVYPNPAKNYLQFTGVNNPMDVTILTMEGRQLQSQRIYNDVIMDINLSSGMYLLNITSEGQTAIRKILVQ